MAQRAAKLVGFGDHGTAGRHIGKRPYGGKQTGEPAGRAGRSHLADVLKGRVGIGFGSAGEANRVGHIWPASQPTLAQRVSVHRAPHSPGPLEWRRGSPYGATGRVSLDSSPHPG